MSGEIFFVLLKIVSILILICNIRSYCFSFFNHTWFIYLAGGCLKPLLQGVYILGRHHSQAVREDNAPMLCVSPVIYRCETSNKKSNNLN